MGSLFFLLETTGSSNGLVPVLGNEAPFSASRFFRRRVKIWIVMANQQHHRHRGRVSRRSRQLVSSAATASSTSSTRQHLPEAVFVVATRRRLAAGRSLWLMVGVASTSENTSWYKSMFDELPWNSNVTPMPNPDEWKLLVEQLYPQYLFQRQT
jgi:hypothetical protein